VTKIEKWSQPTMSEDQKLIESLAEPLAVIEAAPLREIRPEHAARVVRRILGRESIGPRLAVTAFNSAP
jgi:FXSXX-COOH protein